MTSSPVHDAAPENRIVVVRQNHGWEVREERGSLLLRSATVTDWHRVERTMQSFQRSSSAQLSDSHDPE